MDFCTNKSIYIFLIFTVILVYTKVMMDGQDKGDMVVHNPMWQFEGT